MECASTPTVEHVIDMEHAATNESGERQIGDLACTPLRNKQRRRAWMVPSTRIAEVCWSRGRQDARGLDPGNSSLPSGSTWATPLMRCRNCASSAYIRRLARLELPSGWCSGRLCHGL